MTIDDELILELIKPDKDGKVGEKALIVKIVGSSKIDYRLEEHASHLDFPLGTIMAGTEVIKIIPDIVITIPQEEENIAIELENDIQWDFQTSLRQIKNYKKIFEDTRVIIPKDYERFAPLYKNEGFRIYLWKAMRKWQCLRCGEETEKEGPIVPKCKNAKCKNNSPNEFRLVGLINADIEEYI